MHGWPFKRLIAVSLTIIVILTSLYAGSRDPRVTSLVRNTLLLAIGTCLHAIPLGTLLAVLLWRADLPLRRPLIVLFMSLLFVPLYLQAAAWDAGFGLQGWFWLDDGGLRTSLLLGWRAVIWIHGVAAVPWVLLIVGVGLRFVEPETEEAALLDGSAAAVFTRVTLISILPAIGVAGLWIFVMTAGDMTVVDLYQVRTYVEELYAPDPIRGRPELIGFVLGGVALTVCVTIAALIANAFLAAGSVTTVRKQRLVRLPGSWLYTVGIAGLLLLLVGVPVGNLCYKAGYSPPAPWSLAKLGGMLARSVTQYGEPMTWTAVMGGCTAVTSLVVGAPLAWFARVHRAGTISVCGMVAVALAIPGPVVALSLIWLLNRDVDALIWLYDRTIFAPWLAMTVRAAPIATLICWYGLRTVSNETLDAAAMDGAGPVTKFFRIAVAQRWPALGAAFLAAFAISGGDVAGSILVMPPRISTVPVRVFEGLHSGVIDEVAGVCLAMVTCFVVVGMATVWLWRRVSS